MATTWRVFMLTGLNTAFSRQFRQAESLKLIGSSPGSILQAYIRPFHSSVTSILHQQSPQGEEPQSVHQSKRGARSREGSSVETKDENDEVNRYTPVAREPDAAPITLPRGQTVSLGYQMKPFWEGYVRKHKGLMPPQKTRKRCVRGKDKISGNPCPICRDRIEIHFTNTELLEQFICPYSSRVLEAKTTGLCRQQQKRIVAAIEKARNHGYLPYDIPQRFTKEELRIPPWNKVDIR